MINDFAIFITSHNAVDDCPSLDTIQKYQYKGDWYIVIDSDDPAKQQYIDKYETHLLIYNKLLFRDLSDSGYANTIAPLAVVMYARQFIEQKAKELHLRNFVVMDDDIIDFKIKNCPKGTEKLTTYSINNLEEILSELISYQNGCRINTISFGTPNFNFGGYKTWSTMWTKRRTMSNVFLRNVDLPLDWKMAWYEDLNTSIFYANSDTLILTIPLLLTVARLQYSSGNNKDSGMAEAYRNSTSFERQFHSVRLNPSAVKLDLYNGKFIAYLAYNNVFSKIISSKFRNEV